MRICVLFDIIVIIVLISNTYHKYLKGGSLLWIWLDHFLVSNSFSSELEERTIKISRLDYFKKFAFSTLFLMENNSVSNRRLKLERNNDEH